MSSKRPDISVIIPIYNVEEYLEECLDSVLNQTKDNLEVIMIDDGSTDSSGEIAKSYAEKYDNFQYHLIENNGLGHARNYAVPFATGKYIIFLDSDDIVVSDAYEKMFNLAEKNSSDLTICNVARFNSRKSWASNLHKKIFTDIETNTHITKNSNLIYDTTSWNKLILKSFYLENNFQFPEHILYEDIPVTIPMHCKANNVSVVDSIGYLWRVRDGASKSITQNTSSMDNLIDRISVMKMTDKFFDENIKDKDLHFAKQLKYIEIDLMIFINICAGVDAETGRKMLEIIKEYVDASIDSSVFEKTTLINRQKYAYALDFDIDSLIKTIEYQKSNYFNAPIKEENGEFIVSVPEDLFTVKDRNVTEELKNNETVTAIDDVIIKKDSVEIFSFIYKRRFNIENYSQQSIHAYLYNDASGNKLPLHVDYLEKKNLTEDRGYIFDSETGLGQSYNYDGTGFKITVDAAALKFTKENEGTNRILVAYENRLNKSKLFLRSATVNIRRKSRNNTILVGNYRISPAYSHIDEIQIVIKNEQNFAKNMTCSNTLLTCALEKKANKIWAENEDGKKIEFATSNHTEFTADINSFEEYKNYNMFIETADGKTSELVRRNKKINIQDLKTKALTIRSNRTYCVNFQFCPTITVLNKVVNKGKRIALHTFTAGREDIIADAKKAYLCIDDEIAEKKIVLAKSICIHSKGKTNCIFLINFGNKNITKDLYQGYRDVYIEYELKDKTIVRDLINREKHFNIKIEFDTLRIEFYRFIKGTVKILARQQWREAENTAPKRKALTFENYPKYREEKINPKQIVFESMWGSKYSCNPQHLYEYIDKYHPEYQCIWSLKDERTPIPGNAIRVRRGSQEYYKYLATAKYFVNNVNFEDNYVKRDGQIEIQTMHGTPLKTLGLDVPGDFPTEQSQEKYIAKNMRWNYLIVQGKFMEEKAYSCFRFDKEILKTGYPRTDILFNNSPEKIEKIKKDLGLPLDKKIILYTPTWRVKNKFDMQLDLKKMREQLGDEYVILVRLHHFCSSGYAIPADNKFIFDFNSYSCVEELYVISDLLITDYSSVMFDYALLNKPMLFFTYDLEEYSKNLRGLYIDFEAEAPGPLLFDTDEIIDAVLNIDKVSENCRDRIENFKNRYLTYENGNSCEEIFNKVFKNNELK